RSGDTLACATNFFLIAYSKRGFMLRWERHDVAASKNFPISRETLTACLVSFVSVRCGRWKCSAISTTTSGSVAGPASCRSRGGGTNFPVDTEGRVFAQRSPLARFPWAPGLPRGAAVKNAPLAAQSTQTRPAVAIDLGPPFR